MEVDASLLNDSVDSSNCDLTFDGFTFTFAVSPELRLPPLPPQMATDLVELSRRRVALEASNRRQRIAKRRFCRDSDDPLAQKRSMGGTSLGGRRGFGKDRSKYLRWMSLESFPNEILIHICEFCDTLEVIGRVNRFFYKLVRNKFVLARWGIRQLGHAQALRVTTSYMWRDRDDHTGGLELVKYMINNGADILCGDDGMWMLKLLELGKYQLLESVFMHYKDIFFPGEQKKNEGDKQDDENGDAHTVDIDDIDDLDEEDESETETDGIKKFLQELARRAVFKGNEAAAIVCLLVDGGYKSDKTLSKFISLNNKSVINCILRNRKARISREEWKLACNFFRTYSSRNGDLDMIRLFIYHRVFTVDEHGRVPEYPTLLEEAIRYQHIHVVDFLIQHGITSIEHPFATFKRLFRAPPKNGYHMLYHLRLKGLISVKPLPTNYALNNCTERVEWIADRLRDYPHMGSLLRFLLQQGGTCMTCSWVNERQDSIFSETAGIMVRIVTSAYEADMLKWDPVTRDSGEGRNVVKGLVYVMS
ncbi:2379_t:CDS:1 [Paraglomus brasilianum]|uniref:2379_t:CDS:1 n=1 Tax=Paraglomus brasilianum TaxID=144538 RepID=A0A9N9BA68_9GLOM|nr:2379_t:CDS:1 [Paraglomus brasilianum]